jgi:hypothetical protein
MKHLITISILAILLVVGSCNNKKEYNDVCETNDPVNDIEWLNTYVDGRNQSSMDCGYQIIRYKYNGDYVYWIDDCVGKDSIDFISNCSGDVICEYDEATGHNSCPDFAEGATDSTMILNVP